MLSHGSTSARTPGGTRVVVSSWSITAGPSKRAPAGSWLRSYTGVHVGALHLKAKVVLEEFEGDIHEGDVFAVNDPYRGGTH